MFESHLCADYERSALHSQCSSVHVRLKTLEAINKFLQEMGKDISDYHLVTNDISFQSGRPLTKDFISETQIETPSEDLMLPSHLNSEQIIAYDLILSSVYSDEGQSYFIDGPGGTGKTFLYRALLASVRSQGFIAIAVATSGVAASILPGGRTAHSRFKIPLDFTISKYCQLSKQSSVAKLIVECKLIVWDEASMARKEAVEAFDSMLKDITGNVTPFGGKVVVFGGDFRQTLPVMEKSTREEQVKSTIVNSVLWSHLKKLSLHKNMRAALDPAFSDLLLRIGEGKEPSDEDGNISLPAEIVVPYKNNESATEQ